MADKETSENLPMIKGYSRRKSTTLTCIIHYPQNKSDREVRQLSAVSFQKIKDSVKIRRAQSNEKECLESICSQVPEEHYAHIHGSHRWCYKNFTNTARLLKRKVTDDGEQPSTAKRRRSSELGSTVLLPSDKCLFCERNRIKKGGKFEYLVKCITKTAEDSIKKAAEEKQDEHMIGKTQGIDLVAREAHYHNACRKDYTRLEARHARSGSDIGTIEEQSAHLTAFEYIAAYIRAIIIEGCNVERMSMLREKYLQFLLENYPKYHNSEYKTYKLKSKLMKEFGDKLHFWQPNYMSELVYSSEIKGQAIESAFENAASESKRLEEAALSLRRVIQCAQKGSKEMPWPPTPRFLQSDTICPPKQLLDFLSNLISSNKKNSDSQKKQRLTMSFAQDICQAATGGEWQMPKHILLGMTLRHLTGSAEVITLLNRFGHCVSYSMVLEIETAVCRGICASESAVPATIQTDTNLVTHLCWDNFDLVEETPSGSGTTHTAHGIILQDVTAIDDSSYIPTSVKRSGERTVKPIEQKIEPCFTKDKAEPSLTVTTTEVTAAQAEACEKAASSDTVWMFCRSLPTDSTQNVPPWAGWISKTEEIKENHNCITTVDYMPPVFTPITENSTVQHILKLSKAASDEVGQEYTIVTFDLAVAKKAYAIVWQKPEVFGKVIVRMGGFHLLCAYMGALGKIMKCSGFEEILIESEICASGSIEKVMNGKHYNRALRVHKIVLEALERLLLQRFQASHGDMYDEETGNILHHLAEDISVEKLAEALNNECVATYISLYNAFKDGIRKGELGKTAQFWLQYMDRVWWMLQFQRATKTNNLDLHLSSMQDMCSLFFSLDHPNYARYTTVYLLTLLNLPSSHPGARELLEKNGLSVKRSEVTNSRNAVDITIEQTINRHAKSQGGIVGFSRNQSAYYRWCMTRHTRSNFYQTTLELADMDSEEGISHKDLRPSRIIQSEDNATRVVQAISNFMNPFEVSEPDTLFCLSSGAPAPDDVEQDLLKIGETGRKAHQEFIEERLVSKSKSFNAPIKKQKLKTFASLSKTAKVTAVSKKSKEIKAERNVFGQLVIIALENQISLEKVMTYPLGPVPWALATSDGLPVKTDKSKLLHALEENSHRVESLDNLSITNYVIDGNALMHAQVALPDTFGELAIKMFDQLPKVPRVDFVTDSYFPLSIKNIERKRRGSDKAHLIKGPLTKVPRNWKSFLSSEENKQNFIKFLLTEWKKDSYAPRLLNRRVLMVCEDKCFCFSSSNGTETMS